MRDLTLHEKISIKGRLCEKTGISATHLVRLDMSHAVFLWRQCFFAPISYYCNPQGRFHVHMRSTRVNGERLAKSHRQAPH